MIDTLRSIVGARFVLEGTDVAKYSHDWAGGLTWNPICVVRPASTDEVSRVLEATNQAGIPIVPVSGNTSVSGGCYADGSVMVSLDRLNKIYAINPTQKTATVGAGAIVANIHAAIAEHNLVFPLLFSAQGTAQIGGALATNAGGSNVLRFGNVRALCLGIEAVMPDGKVMNLMSALHKDNTGYDLRNLMIGAEGTLGIITGAVLKLLPAPAAYVTAMVACPNIPTALETLDQMQLISGHGVEAFEYMPDIYIDRHLERIAGARAPFEDRHPVNILVQIAATTAADALTDETGEMPLQTRVETELAQLFENGTVLDAVIAKSQAETDEMWARREVAAELALADKPYVGSDLSVPTDQMENFLTRAVPAVTAVDPGCVPFWVAHLGDGNVHFTVKITESGLYDPVTQAIEEIVQDLNGSFSAEHGVGIFKRNSMARRKDPVAIEVMRAIKQAIDPKNLMNPGKIIP